MQVGLWDMVACDLTAFLNLLDELTASTDDEVGLLQETDYTLVGIGDEPNTVMLRVTGKRPFTASRSDGPVCPACRQPVDEPNLECPRLHGPLDTDGPQEDS